MLVTGATHPSRGRTNRESEGGVMTTWIRPGARLAAVAVVVLGTAVLGSTALARALAGEVERYAGCLTTGGTLVKLKEGNAPSSNCTGGQKRVQLSGGDITGVSAGAGLTGGGENGGLALAIGPTFRLPQACGDGQVAKWTAGGWACADDDNTRNADHLDGLYSTDFLTGGGSIVRHTFTLSRQFNETETIRVSPFSEVIFECGGTGSVGQVAYRLLGEGSAATWIENPAQHRLQFVNL